MKYNVLIVGMGGIGFSYDEKLSSKYCYSHYRAFKNNKNFKIVGSVEKNDDKRKYLKRKTKVKIYKSISEIHKTLKIDIVVISTPTQDHLNSIQNSIKYCKPKIILCEKPLSKNISHAKKNYIFVCKKTKSNFLQIISESQIRE